MLENLVEELLGATERVSTRTGKDTMTTMDQKRPSDNLTGLPSRLLFGVILTVEPFAKLWSHGELLRVMG